MIATVLVKRIEPGSCNQIFPSFNGMHMNIKEALIKIRELLSEESRWTKGWFARGTDKFAREANSKEACCWCMVGAAQKIAGNCTPLYYNIIDYWHEELGGDIGQFNDEATHPQLIRFLDRVINKLP